MSSLADRLRKAFIPEKHSQAELARAARVKAPSVSDWFSGETKTLKAEPLVRAAHYLDVSPLWLATGEGPMRQGLQPPQAAEPGAIYGRPAWPFETISESRLCDLPHEDLLRVEGALAAAINALGLLGKAESIRRTLPRSSGCQLDTLDATPQLRGSSAASS